MNDQSTHAHSPATDRAPHHYVLAHMALRGFCTQDPLAFFGVIGSPQRDGLLGEIWTQVCENCEGEGEPEFGMSDVEVITCRIKDYPCMIFRMPEPKEIGEVYFVGIVLHTDITTNDLPDSPEFAFMTLEKGQNPKEEDCTFFCAWTPEDEHVNYGEGPDATLELFVKQLEAMD